MQWVYEYKTNVYEHIEKLFDKKILSHYILKTAMKILYLIPLVILSCLFFSFCNDISNELEEFDYYLHWEVESNYIAQNRFRSQLKLVNDSGEVLDDNWTLYFNFMRRVDVESLPPHLRLTHINGSFYKLEPADEFEPLHMGGVLQFAFDALGSAIKKSDAPDGAYFEFTGGRIVPVKVVIEPFEQAEQMNRSLEDAVPVPTPDVVYEQNMQLSKLGKDEICKVVPSPVLFEMTKGTFTITDETNIYYGEGLEREARFLSNAFAKHLDTHPQIIEGAETERDNHVRLKIGEIEINGSVKRSGDEAYHVDISVNGIEITGSDATGVFYGIQSLRSLFPMDVWSAKVDAITVYASIIKDAPGFPYRGMHLDVSRNFQTVETVKRLLDIMAFYKLNKFHFHLTDDEGWRLEINGFPELTEVGGRRGHTHDERDHLIPSFGSGPEPDRSKGSGWYTQDEYIEILRYANERHIEVIPEIDVPGHARAALVGMKARYDRLIEENYIEVADRYRIHDPDDQSEYMSVQRWKDNVINVCQESTYRFLEVVFDEIIRMHEEAKVPLSTIHVGGDEVPSGVWEDSPICEQFINDSNEVESVDELMDYFFARMNASLSERGLVMTAWEEFSLIRDPKTRERKTNPLFSGKSIPYVWSNIWGTGTEGYSYKLANAGYEIVMSHASNFYFDFAYNKDPEEAGLFWGGFVDTRDPFAFIPFDLYKSGIKTAMGHPIPEDAYDDFEQLSESGKQNILGLQGQLWGETFTSHNRVEYMALPRIIPLAQRAWVPHEEWMDIENRSERLDALEIAWNEFANRLGQRELRRLDYMNGGYEYRIPPPGAIIKDNELKVNIAYPGLVIRYTTDTSQPTVESPAYVEPVRLEENTVVKLRTFDTRGRGSRVVILNLYKENY